MEQKYFNTSNGGLIPASVMTRCVYGMAKGEDWQKIATEWIRPYIPVHDDDLSELNEVLAEVERRIEELQLA